jgi:uncharacterized protein DUF4234
MTLALTAMTYAAAVHNATGAGKQRNPWATAGLNAITLGLYSVYWWYVANRELRDLGRNFGEPELEKEPALSALAFFFGGCLIVPLAWTAVNTARRIRLAQDLVGTPNSVSVWFPVALLVVSATAAQLPSGEGSTAVLAAIAAAVAFRIAAIAYMQYALNEVWQRVNVASTPPIEPSGGPPPRHVGPAKVAALSICAVLAILALGTGATTAEAKASRGGTLSGMTSQGNPGRIKVSRSGRVVREAALTIDVHCPEGSALLPLKARGLQISRGGRFSGRLEDTWTEEGVTVHLFESLTGRFNSARTSVRTRARIRISTEAEDGSSETCDSGPVTLHATR